MPPPNPSRKAPPPKPPGGPPFLVLRDSGEHEGHGWVFAPGEAGGRCLGTAVVNLFTADYSLEGFYGEKIFCVERKATVGELAGNLTQAEKWDDFRQVLERMDEFRHPFVLCEFPRELLFTYPEGSGLPRAARERARVTPNYLLKLLARAELKYRAKFLFLGTPERAREYALGLFKRVAEGV